MVVVVGREEGESGGGRATVESWIGRFGFYGKCQIVIYSISPPFLTSAPPGISEKREKKAKNTFCSADVQLEINFGTICRHVQFERKASSPQ